jgi:DNA-binding beta-propeller fold protein YncE
MKSAVPVILVAAALLQAAPNGYHATGKIQIGGAGGWDYLTMDSASRRLYVSHATKVVVVDVDTQKVVGEIADTQGVHGIALAPSMNRGWTSNGRTNNVTVFDLKTLQPTGTIATGQNPDAIQYDAASKRVFTFNGRSKDATVIDAESGKVVGTIPLGGKPEFSAADGKGKVYVNIEDTHEIAEIDAAKGTVLKKYSLEGCEDPSGLAMDIKARRIFSVCGNKVMVVSDPDAGKVVATVPIGSGADGAGFDPGTGLAFSSNGGDGTLTVVKGSGSSYSVVENAPTQRGARTMTVDPKTHNVYMSTAQMGPAPAATAAQPRPRPTMVPDTFMVLIVGQ